jgi:hypothetical protein
MFDFVCVQAFKLSDAESLASVGIVTQASCSAPPALAGDATGGREIQAVRPAPLRDASRLCKCKRSKCIRQYCICFRRVSHPDLPRTFSDSCPVTRQMDSPQLCCVQVAFLCWFHMAPNSFQISYHNLVLGLSLSYHPTLVHSWTQNSGFSFTAGGRNRAGELCQGCDCADCFNDGTHEEVRPPHVAIHAMLRVPCFMQPQSIAAGTLPTKMAAV